MLTDYLQKLVIVDDFGFFYHLFAFVESFLTSMQAFWNIIKGNNINCGEKKRVSWDGDEINYVAIHESEWLFGPKNQNPKIFCKRYHFF